MRWTLLAFWGADSPVPLTKTDLAFVRQHRGNHNRLGIAVQMSYLQYPGRVLGEKEAPYEPILKLVSAQLAIAPAAWELYAARDETRREHLAELLPRMGMEQFAATHYRSLSAFWNRPPCRPPEAWFWHGR
jgi:TnpA family transposase